MPHIPTCKADSPNLFPLRVCVSAKPVNNNPFQLYCRLLLSFFVETRREQEEKGSIKHESNELEKKKKSLQRVLQARTSSNVSIRRRWVLKNLYYSKLKLHAISNHTLHTLALVNDSPFSSRFNGIWPQRARKRKQFSTNFPTKQIQINNQPFHHDSLQYFVWNTIPNVWVLTKQSSKGY